MNNDSPIQKILNRIRMNTKLKESELTISKMAKTAMEATSEWTLSGFKKTDELTLKTRLETCKDCEFWNSSGFGGTGRCMKCGCSTWAKLRMATEKCPIGKW